MQVTVSRNNLNKSKFSSKSFISTILILLFAFISSAILIFTKKKDLLFEEQVFYFVCCDSSKKESYLDSQKILLKNLGGAGVSFKNDFDFYLVSNIYLEINSANEICENLSKYFPNSTVKKIKTKKISKNQKKYIKKNIDLKNSVAFLYNYVRFYQEHQMDYLSGKISDGKFLSKLIAKKRELELICEKIDLKSEIAVNISNFCELFIMQLTNFLNNFYLSKEKQSYVCEYFVKFIINYLEFYNCL